MHTETNTEKTLVVGATGALGHLICLALARRGMAVRALTRPSTTPTKEQRLAALAAAGIEIVYGDLFEPASLKEPCCGIDIVISVVSDFYGDQSRLVLAQLPLLEVAKRAGVTTFMPSDYGFHYDDPYFAHEQLYIDKQRVVTAVEESGLDHHFVAAACFSEWYLAHPFLGFDVPNRKAVLFGDGSKPFQTIRMSDIAKLVAAYLQIPRGPAGDDERGRKNGWLDLPGTLVSQRQVLDLYQELLGCSFEVSYLTLARLEEMAKSVEPSQRFQANVGLGFAHGAAVLADPHPFPGIEIGTAEDFIREVVNAQ